VYDDVPTCILVGFQEPESDAHKRSRGCGIEGEISVCITENSFYISSSGYIKCHIIIDKFAEYE